VRGAFGGDQAAFRRVNPLDVLATRRLPNTAAMIVAGTRDQQYRPQRRVLLACQRAGVDAHWLELPGGHSWAVWGPGLEHSLPWLAERFGLARPGNG
jgi:S-formylglutathione hydrolase FrmB